jgi:hypothetical protein
LICAAGPSEAPSWGEASSEAELAERHAAALAAQASRPLGLVERQDSANYQPRPPAMTERQDSARNLQVERGGTFLPCAHRRGQKWLFLCAPLNAHAAFFFPGRACCPSSLNAHAASMPDRAHAAKVPWLAHAGEFSLSAQMLHPCLNSRQRI